MSEPERPTITCRRCGGGGRVGDVEAGMNCPACGGAGRVCEVCGRVCYGFRCEPSSGLPDVYATRDFQVDGPVHEFFELTYSNYLVLPRAIMQSMPTSWQREMVNLLEEARRACETAGVRVAESYAVRATDTKGRYAFDPTPHYQHAGNVLLPPRKAG
jgi:hypothetical protein